MPSEGLDSRIRALVDELGRRIVTFSELESAGATKKQVLGRCTRGTTRRLHSGVYLAGTGELAWQEAILAGVLAGGPSARATSFSALRLYRLANMAPGAVHVEVGRGTTLTARGVTVHRSRRATRRRVVQGVPTVCEEEALLSVSHKLSEKVLHRLLTKAWRKLLTTPKKVELHLAAHGKRVPGSEKLQRVAQLYVDHSRGPGSDAEADFLFDLYAALDAHGIEHPELQHVIDVREEAGAGLHVRDAPSHARTTEGDDRAADPLPPELASDSEA